MNNKSLIQLYSDHEGKVSDKWTLYLTEYDRIFTEYRNKQIRILEIGIQNGGSLDIWAKYFAKGEKFIGCDINSDCTLLQYSDPRIKIVIGDVNSDSTRKMISNYSPEFDIVIDDGSHISSDIVKTFAKYFPIIKEGGVFVAEDLHCSYWEGFEGGLFNPFSSITFFKHLADIVNYEHWGVDKRRTDLLKGFYAKYEFELDEDILKQVHSIEFINSMCIVKKSAHLDNLLGNRLISGDVEKVTPVLDKLRQPVESLSQTNNCWSSSDLSPYEELPLRLNDLAESKAQIEQLMSSKSWRLTTPFRKISNNLRRIRMMCCLILQAVQRRCVFSVSKKVLRVLKREGLVGVKQCLRFLMYSEAQPGIMVEGQRVNRNDYNEWIRRYDTITAETRRKMCKRIEFFKIKPLISVVMPVYNSNPKWLIEAIESVRMQIYTDWELCIADDASMSGEIRLILERYTREEKRIKVVFREQNGHISEASNSALKLVTGEWVALLDHDDILSEHALFWVVEEINKSHEIKLIYSDEDKIDERGRRYNANFKCDWNRDLFLSHNMFCHLGVYHADLIKKVSGFRVGLEGAQDYDLVLRCLEHVNEKQIRHIPRVLYHWRASAGSTAKEENEKNYAKSAGERAVNDYLRRNSIPAIAKSVDEGYRVKYKIPKPYPLVSLIIPTRNMVKLLRKCINSILEKSRYPNYEIIIIDNGSDEPETLSYLRSIEKKQIIKVIRDERQFNYSALNNMAVKYAAGDIIGLINNDIEVISPDWIREMVSHACRPEVGAVGALLLYPDRNIQHAGVIMGFGGVAGHAHKNMPSGMTGYNRRAALLQSLSAVTGACLFVRKQLYQEVGGLNEEDLTVAFNDIDFCLKIKEKGYINIWTPYAKLYHHESLSRGSDESSEKKKRFNKEILYMKHSWSKMIDNDPAYSPNLTLNLEDYSLAWPPRISHL